MDPATISLLTSLGGSLFSGLLSEDEEEKNRRLQERLAAEQSRQKTFDRLEGVRQFGIESGMRDRQLGQNALSMLTEERDKAKAAAGKNRFRDAFINYAQGAA